MLPYLDCEEQVGEFAVSAPQEPSVLCGGAEVTTMQPSHLGLCAEPHGNRRVREAASSSLLCSWKVMLGHVLPGSPPHMEQGLGGPVPVRSQADVSEKHLPPFPYFQCGVAVRRLRSENSLHPQPCPLPKKVKLGKVSAPRRDV